MTSARQQLLDIVIEPDAYNRPPRELQPLQLQAAREVLAERREQIAVLRRRADETGVREIVASKTSCRCCSRHTVYKSYPASFVEQGRGVGMLTWLRALWLRTLRPSMSRASRASMMARSSALEQAGLSRARYRPDERQVLFPRTPHATTSNSSGVTLLTRSASPWLEPKGDRVVFMLGPSNGPNSAVEASRIGAEVWGGRTQFIS